jgi:phage/plasmid-like protein (TIGR03299 family)
MAHYFESGFFVREKAWHGLGTVLAEAPRNTREALCIAGLDWHVNLAPVYCAPGADPDKIEASRDLHASDLLAAPDSRAMVRDIHQANGSVKSDVLGIVGKRYVPLQNADAFAWFDPLVADRDVILEAAGSVKEGRHVWILAKMATPPLQVGRNAEDIASPYLLLSNTHDGTRSVTVAFTPIRVVCWNTLSAANRAADASRDASRKVRHTRSAANTLAGVRETINLASRDFTAKALLWREMAKTDLAPAQSSQLARIVQRYARLVFSPQATVTKAKAEGTVADLPEVRAETHLWDLLHKGPGSESAGVSPFGLYMAATHYSDHENGHTAATRLASTWFGNGASVRERAEQEAMALAGIGG